MLCDVVQLLVKLHINIALVSGTLPLEAADVLLYFFLDLSELVRCFVNCCFDFSVDFIVKTLILDCHFIFNFSDLDFYNLISLFDLEVSNLSDKWLDLFSDLLNKFSSLNRVHFLWSLCSH